MLTGAFGEALVLYWLSKHGYECALIDHTGIDLIARSPLSEDVLGISVKTRSRLKGTESEPLKIARRELDKVVAACDAFQCNPYFAVVIDGADIIRVYISALTHFETICSPKSDYLYWRMRAADVERYEADEAIRTFSLRIAAGRWW